jgi:hypothetical protein
MLDRRRRQFITFLGAAAWPLAAYDDRAGISFLTAANRRM